MNTQMYPDVTLHGPILCLAQDQGPADLRPLLQAALAVPLLTTLACQGDCGPQVLPCHLVQQRGRVQILDLVRVGHYGTVSSIPSL